MGIKEGLLRILAGEPWSERRRAQRRSGKERRARPTVVLPGEERRARPTVVLPGEERRGDDRRVEDRRGKGWLRFWSPQ